MYLGKIFQSKCINLVCSQHYYIRKKYFLSYKRNLKIHKSMSNDFPEHQLVNIDCDNFIAIEAGPSSRLNNVNHKKDTDLDKVKQELDNQPFKSKNTRDTDAGKISSGFSLSKSISINKYNNLTSTRIEKETLRCTETLKRKNSNSWTFNNISSPIVIDNNDTKEKKVKIVRESLNLKPLRFCTSDGSTKSDVNTDDFLVIDTLPSEILIDIDHPRKYKKSKRNISCDKPKYERYKRKILGKVLKKSKGSTLDGHSPSVVLLDCDDIPIKLENKICSSNNNNCQPSNSKTNNQIALASNHQKFKSKSNKYKNFNVMDQRHKNNKSNTSFRDCDDIILETTVDNVCRSYLSLDVESDSNFFRNHLLQSSTIYQKRNYSTDKTYDDKEKNPKEKKHKNIKVGSRSSNSDYGNDHQQFSDNENQDSRKSVLKLDNSVLIFENSNIGKFVDCSVIDVDSDIEVEDSIKPLDAELNTSEVKNEIKFKSENTNFKAIVTNESSNDSVQSISSLSLDEPSTSYDNSQMELETSHSEDEGFVVETGGSDFVPLNSIRLSELESCPHISDNIRKRRLDFENLRKWELTILGNELVNVPKKVDGILFNVLSYNVLSQQLLWDNKSLYSKCEPDCLAWSYRWPLFQHEVRHLQPDIITLQEVQSSHYYTHYLPWFKHLGYNCIFKKKTREKIDGCAIIYKAKKFDLIEENSVEYYQPNGENVLDRDNIGIIVRLTPTSFYQPFCVATTHILFNPRRTDVKLAQMTVFLAELDRICYISEEKGLPKYCPIILTGDFNSEPFSPMLKLVRNGFLNYTRLERIKYSNKFFGTELIPPILGLSDYCQHKVLENGRYLEKIRGELFSLKDKRNIEERLIKLYHSDRIKDDKNASSCSSSSSSTFSGSGSSGTLYHAFNFKSVYPHKLGRLNNVPEVTSFQKYWTTVDYIFYSKIINGTMLIEGNLKLVGRYGLLAAKEANQIGPLPCQICPSDHFPLAAQFLLKHQN